MTKMPSYLDGRGMRGILSRGHAKYGISNAPKPGNMTNVQKAAQLRLKKLREANARAKK